MFYPPTSYDTQYPLFLKRHAIVSLPIVPLRYNVWDTVSVLYLRLQRCELLAYAPCKQNKNLICYFSFQKKELAFDGRVHSGTIHSDPVWNVNTACVRTAVYLLYVFLVNMYKCWIPHIYLGCGATRTVTMRVHTWVVPTLCTYYVHRPTKWTPHNKQSMFQPGRCYPCMIVTVEIQCAIEQGIKHAYLISSALKFSMCVFCLLCTVGVSDCWPWIQDYIFLPIFGWFVACPNGITQEGYQQMDFPLLWFATI